MPHPLTGLNHAKLNSVEVNILLGKNMKSLAGYLLTLALALTAPDLCAEEKMLALLLQDAAQAVGRSSVFRDRMELTRYLEEGFAAGTSELEVRKKVFGMLEHLEVGPQTHVSVSFRENWLSLSFMRIENLLPEYGGPQRWDLTISFHFGPDRRLKNSVHGVSFGRYDGPLDDDRKKEPNQPSEPTAPSGRGSP